MKLDWPQLLILDKCDGPEMNTIKYLHFNCKTWSNQMEDSDRGIYTKFDRF
jgi:hypothetical protein